MSGLYEKLSRPVCPRSASPGGLWKHAASRKRAHSPIIKPYSMSHLFMSPTAEIGSRRSGQVDVDHVMVFGVCQTLFDCLENTTPETDSYASFYPDTHAERSYVHSCLVSISERRVKVPLSTQRSRSACAADNPTSALSKAAPDASPRASAVVWDTS